MTEAHTPGPWTARRMHTGGFDIMDPRNRDVVTVYGGGVETESREANARLIAAAPDLLEALRQLLSNAEIARHHLRNDEGGSLIGSALWDTIGQAERAILKATATEQGERG